MTDVRGRRELLTAPVTGAPLVDRVRATIGHDEAGGQEGGREGGRDGGSAWRVTTDELWCRVVPAGRALPAQGWKIHVGAATADAARVLDRVATVLVPRRVAFKFAVTAEATRLLNSREADRASSGKFLTVYPADDAEFVDLVEALDAVTADLSGPAILSDLPCRPGSVVHYRYGGFTGTTRLGNDGGYVPTLVAPDGSEVPDSRTPWFTAPAWARDPWAARTAAAAAPTAPTASAAPAGPAATAPTAPAAPAARDSARTPAGSAGTPATAAASAAPAGGVLVAGRFAVTSAIRHGTKGGVYSGVDTLTGADVVVKQARAHIEVDRSGRDARAAAAHEADLLRRLDGSGLVPAPVALVEHDGTLFLAQERVPGVTLRAWVMRHAGAGAAATGGPDVGWARARALTGELVRVLGEFHARGLVVRDLSPTNVMVDGDDEPHVRLVDLELAAEAGTRAGAAGTPGYRAPEQAAAAHCGDGTHVADPAADLYALGALLFLVCTGLDPVLPDDTAPARPATERIGPWLDHAARHGRTAHLLAPAVLGLLADVPADRWDLDRVRAHLARVDRLAGRGGPGRAPNTVPLPREEAAPRHVPVVTLPGERTGPPVDQVLTGILDHLVDECGERGPDRVWTTTAGSAAMDPCSVQYGAAGVLGVLARAALDGPADRALREELVVTVGTAAAWLARRAASEPVVLPGLHFGRSGVAVALLEAGRVLGPSSPAAADAAAWALRVPVHWPNPDVCHGAAGAGLAQLHLWHATGDGRFADRAALCADGLLEAARYADGGALWPVPRSFDSALAGAAHLGFAHGVAGIGAFLLAAGRALGHDRYVRAARAAALTLARTARVRHDAAWWPQGPADPADVRLAHWCSGSAGAGAFLLDVWRATGDEEARDLARRAAVAVHRSRWHSGTTQCHGLAGAGEFLLDAAGALGDERYRSWAEDCAALLVARAARVRGRLLVADETGTGVSASYGTGLAGVAGFLLRLRYGGPRLWTDPGAGLDVTAPDGRDPAGAGPHATGPRATSPHVAGPLSTGPQSTGPYGTSSRGTGGEAAGSAPPPPVPGPAPAAAPVPLSREESA